ncbi:hypothetical protein PIB30_055001 [Stylosanthes scabra]|uniref:Secreted protein n=1 Tax=Stylosanthes scabra TaxID=79078 RepID=A0ABU6YLD9_9FABA|nr:hypothetical protein [Stylosanthes scabra]
MMAPLGLCLSAVTAVLRNSRSCLSKCLIISWSEGSDKCCAEVEGISELPAVFAAVLPAEPAVVAEEVSLYLYELWVAPPSSHRMGRTSFS